jgi:hypothetical protein
MSSSLRNIFNSFTNSISKRTSSQTSSNNKSQYERDLDMLRNMGVPENDMRRIFTEYAQVQLNGADLSHPGSSSSKSTMDPDSVPTSLLDYAVSFTSSQLKSKIKPQMRVSAFEDNFVTIFESFVKKQARRSRINWKKRYLRLRCHGPTFVLSYYKSNSSVQNYAGQIPLPVGIKIEGELERKQIEVQLVQSDEVDVLLKFKLNTKSEWFDWMSHLNCVKRLLVTETRSAAFRSERRGRNQSVWARDLEAQEKRQKEAAAQNAALERRILELQKEQNKKVGMTREQAEKLKRETEQLQLERDRMQEQKKKLELEMEKLKSADQNAAKLESEIERLKDALAKGSNTDMLGDGVLAKQLRAAKQQLRNMQLQILSGDTGGDGAQSLLYRALLKFQQDGYIFESVDIQKLEDKYKTFFQDDDWAKITIDPLYVSDDDERHRRISTFRYSTHLLSNDDERHRQIPTFHYSTHLLSNHRYEGLFRKYCSNPQMLREVLDTINDIMKENQIRNMDLYRLKYWKTTLNKINFVKLSPADIQRWALEKPWPIRMNMGDSTKLEDCKIIGPPPKARPVKSSKDRLFDDIIRVESSYDILSLSLSLARVFWHLEVSHYIYHDESMYLLARSLSLRTNNNFTELQKNAHRFSAQVDKFKTMQQNLVSSLQLLSNLEEEYKGEFGHLPKGLKTALMWGSQLAKNSYLKRALNREILKNTTGEGGKMNDEDDDEVEVEMDDFVSARELPEFSKYSKMLSMHMPLGAVCGRMRRDRVDPDAIDAFMNDTSFKMKKKGDVVKEKKKKVTKKSKRRSTKKKNTSSRRVLEKEETVMEKEEKAMEKEEKAMEKGEKVKKSRSIHEGSDFSGPPPTPPSIEEPSSLDFSGPPPTPPPGSPLSMNVISAVRRASQRRSSLGGGVDT